MKRKLAALAAAFVALALLAPTARAAEREDRRGDMVSVFGGELRVPADVRQRGSVVSIGGTVRLEGEVTQDVVVIFGNLYHSGANRGAVTAIWSDQEYDGARIGDELISVLGALALRETTVEGDFVNVLGRLESDSFSTRPSTNIGSFFPWLGFVLVGVRLVRLLLIFFLVLLLVALVPERVRRIGEAAPVRYLEAFLVGCLTYLGLLLAGLILLVTVVGPVALVAAYYVLKWLAITGVFYAIGRRVGRSLGRDMSVLGAVLLSFTAFALLTIAPTPFGWFGLAGSAILRLIFFLVVEIPAIGLLWLTRLGAGGDPAPVEGRVVDVR